MAGRERLGRLGGMPVLARGESRELLLVTAEECHLCEHAHEVLRTLDVDVREIDVDSADAERLASAGIPLAFLPVLTDGDRVIAYGRLSEKRLRKKLGL
jgi:hypothetical protein